MAHDDTPAEDGALSRREFGAISMAAGVTAAAGAAQAAGGVAEANVSIKTADGVADAVLVHPEGKGAWPAVILYPDAMGLRPVMVDMAKRLAAEGYTVLAINPFYRTRPAPVFKAGVSFSNPDDRAEIMKLMGSLNHDTATRDGAAYVAFLDAQPQVKKSARIGAMGFCMGGAMTIRTAAAAPDRVGAAVSFHGGNLVNTDPNSPHLLVAKTKAAYHIGIAAGDDEKDPQSKVTLKAALDAAKRPTTMEVYPGTQHGWTVADSAVYDKPQAERAWSAMLATYKQALV